MFYVTILFCAIVGYILHGPVGVVAGAIIGFLIAKIDGVIEGIGKTDEKVPTSVFIKRFSIFIGLFFLYLLFKEINK